MALGRRQLSNKLARLTRIGEILVEEGYLTDDQREIADETVQSGGGHLCDVLVSQRLLTEWELAKCLVSELQLPFIQTANYDISSDVISLLPHAFLHQHRLVPLDRFGRSLVLATSGNISEEVVEEIEETTNYEVMLYVALGSDIQGSLQTRFPIEKVTNELSEKFDKLFEQGDALDESPDDLDGPDRAGGKTDEWRPEA